MLFRWNGLARVVHERRILVWEMMSLERVGIHSICQNHAVEGPWLGGDVTGGV